MSEVKYAVRVSVLNVATPSVEGVKTRLLDTPEEVVQFARDTVMQIIGDNELAERTAEEMRKYINNDEYVFPQKDDYEVTFCVIPVEV